MTNPTPHGQVPEALRLAEQYDHGDPAAHGNAWKAAVCTELRRLAELEAQIEALSGVQALSAAPEGWKAVPVNPTPEMWKAAKSVPDPNPPYPPHYGLVWDAMLAASPTPPAEQQAAPKAAPGDPSAFPMTGDEEESDLGQWQPGTAKPNMDGTYLREFDEGEATSEFHQGVWLRDGFFPSELQDVRWRGRAAPQQEAQEPYAYAVYFPDQPKVELVHELDDLIDDLTNRPHVVTKLYTAPQPSPAAQGDAIEHELAMLIRRIVSSARRNCEDGSNVLKLANEAWTYLVRKGLNGSPLRDAGIESDPTPPAKAADSVQEDAARYRWLRATTNYVTSNGERIDVRNMPEKWDAAIDAALAAQGGK